MPLNYEVCIYKKKIDREINFFKVNLSKVGNDSFCIKERSIKERVTDGF